MAEFSPTRLLRRNLTLVFIASVFIAGILLWPRVATGALRHWDEAWYAEVSREMLAARSWSTPLWNGEPWFHKPPLTFWATAIAFGAFGVNEVSARAFSFLTATMSVGAVAWFASSQAKRHDLPQPIAVGLLAGLLLIAIPEFARYGSRGQIDAPLTLFVAVQLLAFWLAPNNPRWRLVEGIAFGLAVMTKGAAAGLAIVVELAFVTVADEWRRVFCRGWALAIAIGIALATPWHVQQYLRHGDRFLHDYGIRHFGQFFERIDTDFESGPPAKLTYYLDFLIRKQSPWGWLLVGLAAIAASLVARTIFRRAASTLGKTRLTTAPEYDRLICYLSCWATTIPLALSLSRAKWSWYLLPMYPAYALLAALLLARTKRWQTHSGSIVLVALGLAIATASEPFVKPANELFEPQIRDLATAVQRLIPSDQFLYCLQEPKASRSVYPVACVFYFQRQMHTLHGVEHFDRIVSRPGQTPFLLLVHREVLAEAEAICAVAPPSSQWRAEPLGSQEPIRLVRIVPAGRKN